VCGFAAGRRYLDLVAGQIAVLVPGVRVLVMSLAWGRLRSSSPSLTPAFLGAGNSSRQRRLLALLCFALVSGVLISRKAGIMVAASLACRDLPGDRSPVRFGNGVGVRAAIGFDMIPPVGAALECPGAPRPVSPIFSDAFFSRWRLFQGVSWVYRSDGAFTGGALWAVVVCLAFFCLVAFETAFWIAGLGQGVVCHLFCGPSYERVYMWQRQILLARKGGRAGLVTIGLCGFSGIWIFL